MFRPLIQVNKKSGERGGQAAPSPVLEPADGPSDMAIAARGIIEATRRFARRAGPYSASVISGRLLSTT